VVIQKFKELIMSFKIQKPCTNQERADFIVHYNHQKGLKILETDLAIFALEADEILQEGIPVKNPEYEIQKLAEIKQLKNSENIQKAYEAEENGFIVYNDALFETSSSNISKLTSQFAMIQSGILESVQWLSKDDVQLTLTVDDIMAIGKLMAEYTGNIWNDKYLNFKKQINSAETITELESIIIKY